MTYEQWHWRTFNVFARIFGLASICAGVVFGAWAILSALSGDSREDVVTISGSVAIDSAVVSLFALVMGILVTRAPAYRPDLKDSEAPASHAWWTGEPRAGDTARKGSTAV